MFSVISLSFHTHTHTQQTHAQIRTYESETKLTLIKKKHWIKCINMILSALSFFNMVPTTLNARLTPLLHCLDSLRGKKSSECCCKPDIRDLLIYSSLSNSCYLVHLSGPKYTITIWCEIRWIFRMWKTLWTKISNLLSCCGRCVSPYVVLL